MVFHENISGYIKSTTTITYQSISHNNQVSTLYYQCYNCNILGKFVQVDYPEDNDYYLKFEGLILMVNMTCGMYPSYKKQPD